MKIFVVKHKNITLLAGLLAACAIFYAVSYPSAVGAYATDRQLPIYCVEKDQKVCSISFDAAWGNEDTQTLIDILEQYKVKATFFVVGQWVDKYPESVKALSDAGHEVMNHSATHAHYNQLSADEITADVNTCNDKVEAVTGVRPTLIRCPYGEYDDHVVSAIRSIGMEPIQWDVDSLDWKEIPASEITQRVTSKVQPGSIVLFHNAAKHTPEALPSILENLISQGYTIVPISQLIIKGQCGTDYTIDHTGKQLAIQAAPEGSASSAGSSAKQ
ncbi:polysaccharide deacetylase family protein [Oscillibacter hominis]|uniref:Polysaccharide deacetylase family protein n=1 Tax=Oscillibacter hominis TaxID=2763056 RepID=A0A7G9B1P1_9FIRM|nr:polysaccharide deacetylase family protein [Oscillibacter hominis]QNL43472.1 polysaccharide deacetylase family protein [Oscillibacter hominis]